MVSADETLGACHFLRRRVKIKSEGTVEMPKTRKVHRGGDYQTSQQFFNPDVLPPEASSIAPVVTTAPTAFEIRPVLMSTNPPSSLLSGGARRTRKHGGFAPSIMGSFVANAQSAVVPLALYAVYHMFVPKKDAVPVPSGGKKTRRRR